MRGITLSNRLPHWARADNPIVKRELAALPPLLGRGGKTRDKMLFIALAALGLGPCSCLCSGGFVGSLLLLPLSLVPLLFSATIINREINDHTWQDLRATPFSVREIILAKLTAVAYRLGPVLALLLIIQLVSYILSSIALTMYSGSTITINGQVMLQSPGLKIWLTPQFFAEVFFTFGVTLLKVLVDFLTAIALGGLASALTTNRGLSYVLAVGLKTTHFLLDTALALLIIGVALGSLDDALTALVMTVFGSVKNVLVSLFPQPALAVLAMALLFGMEALILLGVIELTAWRASRTPA